jgi:hypothetical protein
MVEREGKKNGRKTRGRFFFLIFAPDFLYPQVMKSTPIYRGWKRDVLSLLVPNLDF